MPKNKGNSPLFGLNIACFHFIVGNPCYAGIRNRGYAIGVIAPVGFSFSSPIYRPRWRERQGPVELYFEIGLEKRTRPPLWLQSLDLWAKIFTNREIRNQPGVPVD